MTRLGAWVGLLLCVASGLGMLWGGLTVFHRSETCVQTILTAQHVGLSTWEAVAKCQP